MVVTILGSHGSKAAAQPFFSGTVPLALCLGFAAFLSANANAAPSEKVLYSFRGLYQGSDPMANLITDASGAIYGTLYGRQSSEKPFFGGAVFKLTTPVSGQGKWTETEYGLNVGLYGGNPVAGVTIAPDGTLYGITTFKNSKSVLEFGDVFSLVPPSSTNPNWVYTDIYDPLPSRSYSTLLHRANGSLYGTFLAAGPEAHGSVFELDPPAKGTGPWTLVTLYSFAGGSDGAAPAASIVQDSDGGFYGTTVEGGATNNGTIFKLTPPAKGATTWTESVLYSFQGGLDGAAPYSALTLGKNGVLYGTTTLGGASGVCDSCGTIFSLTPPAAGQTAWTEQVLYRGTPQAGGSFTGSVVLAANGDIFATANRGGTGDHGTILKLTPPAAGATAWKAKTLFVFGDHNIAQVGSSPYAGLTPAGGGKFYGTTTAGGTRDAGLAFEFTP